MTFLPDPTEPWDAYPGPPHAILDVAIESASRSPCDKSKRGAVIYVTGPGIPSATGWPPHTQVIGVGHNGPPAMASRCTRDPACYRTCGALCVHAEARALEHATESAYHEVLPPFTRVYMAHIKVATSRVDGTGVMGCVPGGGPSCVYCAKQILDSTRIHGIWLYELTSGPELARWRCYGPLEFNRLSVAAYLAARP